MIFLQFLNCEFVEKSPSKSAFVRNSKSLNPEIMCSKPEWGKKCFRSLVDNLTQLERVTPKDGGIIYAEYKSYVENVPKNR